MNPVLWASDILFTLIQLDAFGKSCKFIGSTSEAETPPRHIVCRGWGVFTTKSVWAFNYSAFKRVINSSPVMVSFSYRYLASSSSFARFSVKIFMAFSVLLFHKRHDLPVDFRLCLRRAGKRRVAAEILFVTVSSATMSKSLLMPYRVIIARASLVACSMSLEAPVEAVPKISSSAARPPV